MKVISAAKQQVIDLVMHFVVSSLCCAVALADLRSFGVIIKYVDNVENLMIRDVDKTQGPAWWSRVQLTMVKLRAWQLTEYDRVVLLDLDILPLDALDLWFDYPIMAALPQENCNERYMPPTCCTPYVATIVSRYRLLIRLCGCGCVVV
jgi:alpha-N-acetylglucosamine transferase